MRDYLLAKRKEEKDLKKKKAKSKGKHKDETPEERAARKARKKAKKEKKEKKSKSEGMRGVEELLKSLGQRELRASRDKGMRKDRSRRSRSRDRSFRDYRVRPRSPMLTHDKPSDRPRAQHGRRSEERSCSPYDDSRYDRTRHRSYSRSPSDDYTRQRNY